MIPYKSSIAQAGVRYHARAEFTARLDHATGYTLSMARAIIDMLHEVYGVTAVYDMGTVSCTVVGFPVYVQSVSTSVAGEELSVM